MQQVPSQAAYYLASVPIRDCLESELKQHASWIERVVKSVTASLPLSTPQICVRVKPQRSYVKNVLSIKQNRNRARIGVTVRENSIVFDAFHLPDVNPKSVFKPRMGTAPDESLVCDYSEEGFHKAYDFVLKHLDRNTCYANGDYGRIKVSNSDNNIQDDVFFAGLIDRVIIAEDGRWSIRVQNKGIYTTLLIAPDMLRGPRPSRDVYLVYKNNKEAEIETSADFERYYQFID